VNRQQRLGVNVYTLFLTFASLLTMMAIARAILSIIAFTSGHNGITVVNGAVRSDERSIQIVNNSGHLVDIYWVHPQTSEMVKQSEHPIYSGASFDLSSFTSHTFQAIEVAGKRSGACKENTCKTNYFTVSENDDQVFFLEKGLEKVTEEDNISIAQNQAVGLLHECREKVLESISSDGDASSKAINKLVACVKDSISVQLEKANEEIAFQASVRTKMGNLLENYTCADHALNTTKPVKETDWKYNGEIHAVKVMHDRSNSKIHFVENFIKPEECEAMEYAARSSLHKATVADTDGGSRLSDSRKALQAGITVPWKKEKYGNPIAVLSRRVFDYTNSVTDFGLEEFGQEDLMSIQYIGRGVDDEAPDRYSPHCDGDCTGRPHKDGQRVATMVMYCVTPERGGATNFRNSGIHVVPKAGSAVFFAYMGDDGIMDKGFTEHSGCPVLEGEKKIVTQWMRKGVDKDNQWSDWNTLGMKISELRD